MAEQEKRQCPNCGKKDSLWSKILFLSQKDTDFINKYHEPKRTSYCDADGCGTSYLIKYKNVWVKGKDVWEKDRERLKTKLKGINFDAIPVISLPNPQNWQFEIIDLVTAQTTTGTGAVTEILAQVADFMGEQSDRHNNKIQTAINICKQQLRKQAIQSGGNAVIDCDVDLATGGTGNGLIIVCMSGTVVKVKNTEVFNGDVQKKCDEILLLQSKIAEMDKSQYNKSECNE